MVDFSNLFILFSYVQTFLDDVGIDITLNWMHVLYFLAGLFAVNLLLGILLRKKDDPSHFSKKNFFLKSSIVIGIITAVFYLANVWDNIMNHVPEGIQKVIWGHEILIIVAATALFLLILFIIGAKSENIPDNNSMLNRHQKLVTYAFIGYILIGLYVFYQINDGAFEAFLSVFFYIAEIFSVMFWLYDPIICILSKFVTVKPKTTVDPTPHRINRFAVIGCAHNEEGVIDKLVKSVYETTYPRNSYDIYVICDNCTDGTADKVRESGAIAMERQNPDERGKGFGLKWMFEKLDNMRKEGNEYDAYIVLDADNVVNEAFLDEINYKLNQGYEILQAYLGCKNPTDTFVSKCYSYAYWVSNAQYQKAHSDMGLTAQMGGTGMVIRPKVLDEIGWNTDSLTEDLVLTSRYLLATNQSCCWVDKAILYDEKPLDVKPSIKQRTRWMQGHMDAMFKYAHKLFFSSIRNLSLKQFDMAFYLTRPFINLILLATYMIRFFFNLVMPESPLSSAFIMTSHTATLLLIAAVMLQAYLLFNEYYARYIYYFFLQLVFTFTWYPAIFRGLIKRNERYWLSTVHTRNMDINDVKEDAELMDAKERLRGLDNLHRLPLGQILLKAAVISKSQLEDALRQQEESGGRIGDIIVNMNAVDQGVLDAYLCIQKTMKEEAEKKGHNAAKLRLGDMLVDSGLITDEQRNEAVKFQIKNKCRIGEAIIGTKCMSIEFLNSFLNIQKILDLNYVTPDSAKQLITGLLESKSENLGTILKSGGLISEQQLKLALEKQEENEGYIGEILVDMGFLDKDTLDAILEYQKSGRNFQILKGGGEMNGV